MDGGEKIAVMGSGYVGLVAAGCLSELGNDVNCIDIDEDRIRMLEKAEIPIHEPGLEEIVRRNLEANRLRFSSDWEEFLADRDIIFIAVGTPRRPDGTCELEHVMSAAEMIAEAAPDEVIVVNKSTVPVGTGDLVAKRIRSLREEAGREQSKISVVSNPEFLREGSAVGDFMEPDRVVVGSNTGHAKTRVGNLYEELDTDIVRTDLRTAEMIKYASNAFLATKISFINEIANVCEGVGADVEDVARGMGKDSRISSSFLGAGVGYGGSCFPKDTQAFIQIANHGDYRSRIIDAVIAVNSNQRKRFAMKIVDNLPGKPEDSTVAVLGVTFKPNTDDLREAPALDIIPELQQEGIEVKAHDPMSMEAAAEKLRGVDWCDTAYEALEGADAVAMITEWDEYLQLDWERAKNLVNNPVVLDGRNALPMGRLVELGFEYYGVGRGVDRLDNLPPDEDLL